MRRNLALLLAAIIVIGAGEEMWMRFLPKYLESVGASVAVIGIFDALKTLLGAIYAYPGGVIADRWGYRRALILFNCLSICGYVVVLSQPHWWTVLAGMFFFLAWTFLALPANFSLVSSSLAANQHAMGIGMQSLVRRIPILAGPLAGGLLIDRFGVVDGVRLGLGASIVFGIAGLFIQRLIREEGQIASASAGGFREIVRSFDRPLVRLLWSDVLVRFCERIPFAWVVIYAMDHVGISAVQVGLLTGIEVAVAMASYVPVARLSDRYGKEPFVIATFLFFTLFPLALAAARSFPLLVIAFAIRGLKEFGDPARKALILFHSPPESRGRTVGAYYLIRDTVVTAGSFAGAALWAVSPRANFLAAAAFGALGTLGYAVSLRRMPSP